MRIKKSRKLQVILISVIVLMIAILVGFYIYTRDYYIADEVATNILEETNPRVSIKDNITILYPSEDKALNTALIFYPGGKVEANAYLPLLQDLSDQGITSVLVEMPFHLAVFNINGADDVYEHLPEIDTFYIGGHSLGGAMSASYVSKHLDQFKGLILLGAYPTEPLDIPILSIYGSNDMVLDHSKLLDTAHQVEIPGGNHAYYGNYGEQEGDGTATITREEQQAITVDEIMKFIVDRKE